VFEQKILVIWATRFTSSFSIPSSLLIIL